MGASDPPALAACSSSVEPEIGPTVLVINAACQAGPCEPLNVRGWVPKYLVPGQRVLGGFLEVGVVESARACLAFPPSDSLIVVGPPGDGLPDDTTVVRWSPADVVEIMVFPDGLFPPLGGITSAFAPSSEPGWRLTYPDADGRAVLEPSVACQPDDS